MKANFPECFFGVKGCNHVHDKVRRICFFGCLLSLISAVACCILFDNTIWASFLGLFVLFLLATLGNLFRVRLLYIPLLFVFGFGVIIWTFAVLFKLGFDLCWLNQPLLHRYIGPKIDQTFPPLNTEARVEVLIGVIMEFLLLLPAQLIKQLMSTFFLGFLYLEHECNKKNHILPVRIDPFLLGADSYSTSTE